MANENDELNAQENSGIDADALADEVAAGSDDEALADEWAAAMAEAGEGEEEADSPAGVKKHAAGRVAR